MRESLELCSRGLGGQRFLFEVLPDVFPQGFLTDMELILWGRFYDERKPRPQ